MDNDKQTGSCLCGVITYEFNQSEALSAHHCHCRDCQKITGSGKATILLVPSNSLDVSGDLKFYTVEGSAGSHVSRGFCSECGSQLISYVNENPDLKFIKVGSIDDSSWVSISSNFGAPQQIHGHQPMIQFTVSHIIQTSPKIEAF